MTHSDRNVGARQIDYMLFEKFSEEFMKKHGVDPRENTRSKLRLLDAIEKVRKLLSSNKEADINCDSLLEDIDFHRSIKREELESLIEPFIKSFSYCL
jgi:heat shock protein 4